MVSATELARNGKALLPVVVGKDASPRVRQAADTLAVYLGKISGARFTVMEGDGTSGIAVGIATRFPRLPYRDQWRPVEVTKREDYLLRSHDQGIHVLGATEQAVEHAVWDLLYRVGYRQFFPGPTWEVVPAIRNLSLTVNAAESPDYHSRRIWYGFGAWDYAAGPYADWCTKNRANAGIVLNTGHSYAGHVRANQKEFDAHPEYFALRNGQRNVKAQLCLSNEALRRLIAAHAVRYFDANPDADSISMDPNDGDAWCECEQCARMGSVSTRVVTLANEVAAAVQRKHAGKYVGIYAYASHSPPPAVKVHPNVVVSVATSFVRGGFTLDELITGWAKQGATLGIREYYSVHTWDRDLPGRSRGSNLSYLTRTIPEFRRKGARFLSAESSDNWAPNGLGYFLASRTLWDVNEAQRAEEIVEDFLTRAFGPAREPMRRFYKLIDGSNKQLLFTDQIARMYRLLGEAKQQTDSPAIHARLNDLLLYTHYVDLYERYSEARGPERQAAFEQVIRHGYRIRTGMMIHAKALYRDVASRDKSVSIPADAQWQVAEAKNPWKSSQPFTATELTAILTEGIKSRPLAQRDFEPVVFGMDLVPARSLRLAEVKPAAELRGRGTQTYYAWIDNSASPLELKITGGLIAHYRDRGNVHVKLWNSGADAKPVAEDRSTPPDGKERTIRLTAPSAGLYRLTVSDGGDMTRVAWAAGTPVIVKSSLEEPLECSGRWSLYFYVPKGTKVIGLFGGGTGDIVDPQGKKTLSLNGKKLGYHSVPVTPGNDGKLWQISNSAGAIRLLTVPPYLARSGEELLLPAELIRRDGKK